VDMHWKVKGYYSHEGDHHKQQGVRSGAVGDLVAVTHGHEQAPPRDASEPVPAGVGPSGSAYDLVVS
jgi:hypothetical protein